MVCERVCHIQRPICVCRSIGCGQHVVDRSVGSQEGSQHHVLRRGGSIRPSSQNRARFIEALEEHNANNGEHLLRQCLRVRDGRRTGGRAWQNHFVDILKSKECRGNFKQSLKSTTIFCSSEFEIASELHKDDGYVTGLAEHMEKVLSQLETKDVLKLQLFSVGNSFEHVGALRVVDEEDMWVRELDKYQDDHPELYKSTMRTILHITRRQSCKPQRDGCARGSTNQIKSRGDSWWRWSDTSKAHKTGQVTTATGNLHLDGNLMVGGCRLHNHCRTTGQHALRSRESEIMSMSELLKPN